MSEPAPPPGDPAYRVTAYYVCHDWRLAGTVEVFACGPLPPTADGAGRLAFAAAETAVRRADAAAGGARIDVESVTVHPPPSPGQAARPKGKT